jgi:hypothetical protein
MIASSIAKSRAPRQPRVVYRVRFFGHKPDAGMLHAGLRSGAPVLGSTACWREDILNAGPIGICCIAGTEVDFAWCASQRRAPHACLKT